MHTQDPNSTLSPPEPLTAGRPYLAVSLIPLAAGVVGLIPPLMALLVGAAIAGLGVLRIAWELRSRTALRKLADQQLVAGALPPSAPLLTWRASELVSRRNRRVLARTLRSIAAESEEPRVPTSSPVNRRAVRPHVDLVAALASRVGSLDESVNPRGMALVEHLICDGFGPLYFREKAGQLRGELERCLSALELPATLSTPAHAGRTTTRPARERAQIVVRHRGRH